VTLSIENLIAKAFDFLKQFVYLCFKFKTFYMKLENLLFGIFVLVVLVIFIQQLRKRKINYNIYYLIRQDFSVNLNGHHNNLSLIDGDDNTQSTVA
jgi:hypothetical protein